MDALRLEIASKVPQVAGDTVRDGRIILGNFSYLGDNPTTDERFQEVVVAVLDGRAEVLERAPMRRSRSGYIEPGSRDGYLEGPSYGGEEEGLGARRDDLRGRPGAHRYRIARLAEEAVRLRQRAVADARAGEGDPALRGALGRVSRSQRSDDRAEGGDGAVRDAPLQGQVGKSYGEPCEGSITVVAYHYSQALAERRRAVLQRFNIEYHKAVVLSARAKETAQ